MPSPTLPDREPPEGGPPRAVIAEVVARYGDPLTGYAERILGDRERARDVVQDTFLRFYEAGAEVPHAAVKAWLYRVCRNRALDVLRHERRAVGLDAAPEPAVDPRGERARFLVELGQMLDDLPDDKLQVVALRYRDGRSYRQISEHTGLSVGHVGSILHHAVKTLQSRVALGAAIVLLVLTAVWWPLAEPSRAERVVPSLLDGSIPERPATPLEIEPGDERMVESPYPDGSAEPESSAEPGAPPERPGHPDERHGFEGETPPHLQEPPR